MRKWRVFTWVILAFNVLMVIWLVSGMASVANNTNTDCVGEFADACKSGAAVGGAIGFGLILFVWALGDVILGVLWMVTRKPAPVDASASGRERLCEHCAERIQLTAKACKHCGRDVAAADIPVGNCQSCGAPPAHPPTSRCHVCQHSRV